MEAKEPGQRSAVKAASRRSRSRAARALTALCWSGSGLPCDLGRTSHRARATKRHATNDGARNADFECFLSSSGTRPLHAVPLQCYPKQCAGKGLRPPTARSDIVAFILPSDLRPSSRSVMSGIVDSGPEGGLVNIDASDPKAAMRLDLGGRSTPML
jgi:hypothetical protein